MVNHPRLYPHLGLDAVREGMRIVTEMDYLIAKTVSPFKPAVFGCGLFNGGTVANAIPDYVFARGTIRAMDSETDLHLKKQFQKLIERVINEDLPQPLRSRVIPLLSTIKKLINEYYVQRKVPYQRITLMNNANP